MSKFELQPATPSVKEIFDAFEQAFFEALQEKTSWGRNEIKEVFLRAKFEAITAVFEII